MLFHILEWFDHAVVVLLGGMVQHIWLHGFFSAVDFFSSVPATLHRESALSRINGSQSLSSISVSEYSIWKQLDLRKFVSQPNKMWLSVSSQRFKGMIIRM
ncbi:hypothetical protein [Candidatus Anaplasma sp. TIGMIC]|uniref:hypothetical protein n=1 Tax=Candidatus Anaplasma sp. TIGMIC TaxID=3020713 RepID=UPI00232B9D3A|nr:hypothetical protein [Candidatus Anaplasma sp. TIGMIC]MDB1135554.1 hypothetical protein [Candidatus Anaplasma sp. TIGMIC]